MTTILDERFLSNFYQHFFNPILELLFLPFFESTLSATNWTAASLIFGAILAEQVLEMLEEWFSFLIVLLT